MDKYIKILKAFIKLEKHEPLIQMYKNEIFHVSAKSLSIFAKFSLIVVNK